MIIAKGEGVVVTLIDTSEEKTGSITSTNTIGTAIQGATLDIKSGTYNCTGSNAFWAGGKNSTGTIIVGDDKHAPVITAQEFGLAVGKDSVLTVNDGKVTTNDNAVFGGNGSAGYENATITINGGEFNGHIQTAGYTGCGIYMPNSGKVTVNGGKFTVDGVGICARAGEVEVKGGEFISTVDTEGWVGDKKTQISANGIYYDGAAKYPGLDATAKVTVSGGTYTNTTNTDIKAVKITQPDNGIIVQSNIEGWSIAE